MLPRVVPEPQYPGYDQNGQPRARYTTTWATRALGTVPQGSYPNSVTTEKHWEHKNTYETMCWAFFLALFKLCCALAFSCLAIYHWAEATTDNTWDQFGASQLLMAGLSSTVVASLAVVAFFPEKRGRITKRLMVAFSFPSLIQLLEALQSVSTNIGNQTNHNQTVNGFYIAEVILAAILLLLGAVLLFPASEGCAPFEMQASLPIRAIGLSVNTVVGAIVLIYFCFSVYGVHAAFDTTPAMGPPIPSVKLVISAFAIPITSLLLLGTLGSFVAFGRGIRPHIIPSVVIGVVSIAMLIELLPQYIKWVTVGPPVGHTGDWHDDAYVGMLALNCVTLVGLVVQVSMGVAFMVY